MLQIRMVPRVGWVGSAEGEVGAVHQEVVVDFGRGIRLRGEELGRVMHKVWCATAQTGGNDDCYL